MLHAVTKVLLIVFVVAVSSDSTEKVASAIRNLELKDDVVIYIKLASRGSSRSFTRFTDKKIETDAATINLHVWKAVDQVIPDVDRAVESAEINDIIDVNDGQFTVLLANTDELLSKNDGGTGVAAVRTNKYIVIGFFIKPTKPVDALKIVHAVSKVI